ncbi:tetratricopeptide repeat protein [candidate division KSB1 bacterium]|nr:tetratricopeptide repeat protein [candidate division KSB1 bacterium]RQW00587.1 MAG: tetratricopeptide repeat protein [candidate division KSB1 bacterium]
MKRKSLFFILIFASITVADQADYLFQQGVDAYQESDYQAALTHFEAALQHGKESDALYYNLGNAYYKLGEIGLAILYYERAKKLNPTDDDINFNLQIAQLRVVDKIPSPETDFFFKAWNSIKNILSLEHLAILTIVLYVLLIALIVLKLLLNSMRLVAFVRYSWLPLLVLLILVGSLFIIRIRQDIQIKHGILLVDKVSVVSSPAIDSTEMFALHEGVKIEVIAESGEFVRIRLTDGKDGWVPREVLEII